MRTPGCDQQKREAAVSTPAGVTEKPPSVSDPSPRDSPQSAPADRPVTRQAAEVPAPARSEQRETIDPSGPSVRTSSPASESSSPTSQPSSSPGAAASCGARSGGGGEPAAPSRPYGFAYNAGTHYHWERGFANGTKIGAYAVQLPDGTLRTTTYTADCNGFKPSVTVEPLDESKFLRDFEAFDPPKEAKLFEVGGKPEASALVRSKPAQAPKNLLRSAEVSGAPPGLTQRQEQRKATTTTSAPTTPPPTTTEPTTTSTTTTTTSTTTAPTTTAAPPPTSSSPRRPTGGNTRRLTPIVPLRPVGSGPYHFYVHLRHNYHEERSYENGTVAGQYGVVGPDGVLREVGYTSEHGFVPTLTDTPVSADHDLSTRPQKL